MDRKSKKELRRDTRKNLNRAFKYFNESRTGIALTMSNEFYVAFQKVDRTLRDLIEVGRRDWKNKC